MSAPLHVPTPKPYVPLPPTPMLGWRMEGVRAAAVRPGHFTTFNGYRRVMSVAEGWVTSGRGKNRRTYLRDVAFERSDGSVDKLAPDDELTIYAPDVA